MHLLLTCLLFAVVREVSSAFNVLFWVWLLLPLQHAPPPPLCVSAKPFVTAVKGPSSEGQSPPEHGLHVLGSDRLCHCYSQQARTARHPAPSLPWSRGKTLADTPLLIHPVQLHPEQPKGQPQAGQITLHTTALHNCPYQISTWSKGVVVEITTSTKHGAKTHFDLDDNSCSRLDVLCCLSIYLVMAGHDIGWPARILTRVSAKLWIHIKLYYVLEMLAFFVCLFFS